MGVLEEDYSLFSLWVFKICIKGLRWSIYSSIINFECFSWWFKVINIIFCFGQNWFQNSGFLVQDILE